jgi:hypothetical protein
MKWGPKFLDIAFESKCRIRNYPAALEDEGHIIGRKFELKKVRAETFKQFMPALAKANRQRNKDDEDDDEDDTVMEIVPWDNCRSSSRHSNAILISIRRGLLTPGRTRRCAARH